jgi:putative heme iron utilization protein
MTLNLGDFNLYELEFGRGRYVAGFAHAFNLGPDTFNVFMVLLKAAAEARHADAEFISTPWPSTGTRPGWSA